MSTEPIHILLVEDNPGDAMLMEAMLSDAGGGHFQLKTAGTLAAGLDILEADGISVILLDLSLPDSEGLETVTRVHERAPRIPLIVMTGLDDEELALGAMQLGAQDYIVKGSLDGRTMIRVIRYSLERTRVERELTEQRNRLDLLLNNIPDRIYFKDTKGRFLQVNPALATYFRLENPQQAIGRCDADFFTQEHIRQAAADEAEIMRTGKPMIGQVEKETFPDGRVGWSLTTKMALRDEKGTIVGTFGVSRDITELKGAENALVLSEDRYRRLLNSVTDYVYTVEVKDGAAISTSHGHGCLPVTGYSSSDFKNDPWLWHRIIHPDDRTHIVETIGRKTAAAESFEIEHRIIRRDGAVRWVRNKHVPRTDPMGRLLSYDGLISDITERKIAQDELVAANERMKKLLADLTRSHDELKSAQSQLIQAEKLHSVGQLAAGVAHEVKNPLQVLLVGLEYLGGCPLAQDETARSVINEMTEAIRRADEVIRDLLDFASPRDLGMQPGSLNAVIEQSLKFVKHDLAKAGIKLVRKLDSDLPPVFLDATKMEQVFINLLTNACHAMTKGGSLTVSTARRTMTADEASHQAGDRSGARLRGGDEVVVAQVRDQGSGIREEHLQKIFEPFFTTKSTGHGTGLGLPVTKTIVDLHRGQISISNNPSGGVTVTLIFKAHIHKNPTKGETP